VPKLVLWGSDIQIIAERLSTLLADRYLDSVIDLRRSGKPRVWLRSAATNGFDRPAVGFERIGHHVWISIVGPEARERGMAVGQPFTTISAAFVYLSARLESLADAGNGGAAPWQNGVPEAAALVPPDLSA
jgi:hypothetical protein